MNCQSFEKIAHSGEHVQQHSATQTNWRTSARAHFITILIRLLHFTSQN